MTRVRPDQPGGVRDYLPAIMIPRTKMLEAVTRVFESFGFDPIATPAMERMEVLTGNKPGFNMAIYETTIWGRQTKASDEHRTALRFDHTVALARVIAANPQIPMPFKRYARGNVWRGEQPQKGRFREFMQFDADIVGSASIQADAEIVQVICATLKALEVGAFTVRINNRKVLNGLPAFAGFPEEQITKVLQILDKMDKVGWSGVAKELAQNTDTQMNSPELSSEVISKIEAFVNLEGDSNLALLEAAAEFFGENPAAQEGIAELREMAETLNALGESNDEWKIDFSLTRGLDYYTGPVFEARLDDLPEIGSVFGGGRYDGLVERFVNRPVPATGAALGVDRLFEALEILGKIEEVNTQLQALVMVLDKDQMGLYTRLASEMRDAGIRSSVYLGSDSAFKAQLSYAAKLAVPTVVIIGSKELGKNTATIKDMRARKQTEVPREELIETLHELLAS